MSNLTASDLRIWNYLFYATEEGEVLSTKIDWQDLKWLSEGPKGFNFAHTPILAGADILEALGFKNKQSGEFTFYAGDGYLELNYNRVKQAYIMTVNSNEYDISKDIRYVHEVQNLVHAVLGVELEFKL